MYVLITLGPKITLRLGTKLVFVLLLSLLLLGGGVTLITVAALTDNPSNTNQYAYGNTSAVIASFSTLNVDSISLSTNNDEVTRRFDLADLETRFYYTDSCSNLHSTRAEYKNTTLVSLHERLVDIRYFLEQSDMSFNVCSAANKQVNDHINFYILNNLQDSLTDTALPYKHYERYWNLTVGFNENASNQTKPESGWNCCKLYYKIHRPNYYPVVVLPPQSIPVDAVIKYWYQVNITQRKIDTGYLTPCHQSSDKSRCRPNSHLPLQKHCIIAQVKANFDSRSEDLYVNIRIEYLKWAPGLPIFLSAGTLGILLSLVPCLCLYRRPIKTRVKKLPSDFVNSITATSRL